jgi:hypothetical protein
MLPSELQVGKKGANTRICPWPHPGIFQFLGSACYFVSSTTTRLISAYLEQTCPRKAAKQTNRQ